MLRQEVCWMKPDRRVVVAITLVVALLFVAGALRLRMSKAQYHSERLHHWVEVFLAEVMELQITLADTDDAEYLSRRLGEIRTAVRYLEMIIGQHDDRLGTLAGVPRLREVPGGEFGRLWWALRRVQKVLLEDVPPDLAGRTQRAAEGIDAAAQEMRQTLRDPEGRALVVVRVLSPRQKIEFNDLLTDMVDAVNGIVD